MAVTWRLHGGHMAVAWRSHGGRMAVGWRLDGGSFSLCGERLHGGYMASEARLVTGGRFGGERGGRGGREGGGEGGRCRGAQRHAAGERRVGHRLQARGGGGGGGRTSNARKHLGANISRGVPRSALYVRCSVQARRADLGAMAGEGGGGGGGRRGEWGGTVCGALLDQKRFGEPLERAGVTSGLDDERVDGGIVLLRRRPPRGTALRASRTGRVGKVPFTSGKGGARRPTARCRSPTLPTRPRQLRRIGPHHPSPSFAPKHTGAVSPLA